MMRTMALQLQPLPLSLSSYYSSFSVQTHSFFLLQNQLYHLSLSGKSKTRLENLCLAHSINKNGSSISSKRRRKSSFFVGKEDIEMSVQEEEEEEEEEEDEEEVPPSPEDLEYVKEIKRVLELLKKNRDMLFSEVKLTIMIEDPREVERRRLLGIEDPDAPTRDDLVEALEQVNEGKVPKDRIALRMLAEEMLNWPNLEVEAPKTTPSKSLYAKATDTGVNLKEAAKRLKIDWDSAAEIEEVDTSDDTEVPPALGYGALYLVTAFPVIIGISVVLILFYNSLQ